MDTNNNHNKTNNNKSNNNELSRRECSELGSAAVTEVAGVLAMTGIAAAQEQQLVPGVKAGKSTHITDPGPTDKQLDAANPDISAPPRTDAGGLPTSKYPFSFNNRRVYEGEWSREVTVPKLPMSKTLAGVDMRLTAGGIRELHWHTAAEWAIMLYGSERITTIDDEGRSFVRDTHVLLSDLMVHTPKEVLPKNFGIPEPSLATLRNKELFIFQGPVPPALAEDQRVAAENLPPSPCHFSFRTSDQASTKKTKGGEVLIVDSSAFKVSTTIAAAVLSTGERASHYGFRGGRRGLRAANAGRLYLSIKRHTTQSQRRRRSLCRPSDVTPRPPSDMRKRFGDVEFVVPQRTRTPGIPLCYSSPRRDLRVCKSS